MEAGFWIRNEVLTVDEFLVNWQINKEGGYMKFGINQPEKETGERIWI